MVVATGFDVFLADTVTGKITAFLPVASVSWGMRLNGPGSVTAKLRPAAREYDHLDLRSATTVLRQSLGVAYDGVILEAGPIRTQDYDAGEGVLTLEAEGLWSIFDRRKVLSKEAPGAAATSRDRWQIAPGRDVLAYRGVSLAAIARDLVARAIQNDTFRRLDGLPAGHLNIDLGVQTPGTRERTYYGFDLATVGDRLHDLAEVEDGPDIRFRPRFSADDATVVEWALELGTEAAPLLVQSGPDWTWDLGVDRSGAVQLSVSRSGDTLASRTWAPGAGQEAEQLIEWQTSTRLIQAGYPWTEADTARKDVDDIAILQAGADRALEEAAAPWDEWSLTVRADTSPRLGLYLPGDWAAIAVGDGHPIVPRGTYRVRILAIDGDGSAAVKLTVAPIQGSLP
jgi:hypothetical protein